MVQPVVTTEANIMRAIQVACTAPDTRLWRFNCGNFLLADGRRIIVGTPGMADLQGLRSVTITADMVGRTVAIYCAVEVKRDRRAKRTEAQAAFIDTVRDLGGLAGFACSIDEARQILTL
jgi:hypothetical protein